MPLDLTLDLMHEEIYYTNHYLNCIEVVVVIVSCNGENRRKILANTHFLPGAISITLFENSLY